MLQGERTGKKQRNPMQKMEETKVNDVTHPGHKNSAAIGADLFSEAATKQFNNPECAEPDDAKQKLQRTVSCAKSGNHKVHVQEKMEIHRSARHPMLPSELQDAPRRRHVTHCA